VENLYWSERGKATAYQRSKPNGEEKKAVQFAKNGGSPSSNQGTISKKRKARSCGERDKKRPGRGGKGKTMCHATHGMNPNEEANQASCADTLSGEGGRCGLLYEASRRK